MLWVDCDPGHDDLMALVLAANHPRSLLLGVSTVDGNSSLRHTTQNALDILFEIGRKEVPVLPGADRPLCRPNFNAAAVHGENGLAGAELLRSPARAVEGVFVEQLSKRILAAPRKVDLVLTGPMTNLALLFLSGLPFHENIGQVTVMGGAIGRGNVTASAEFNILVDPEAASICLRRCKELDIKLTLVPLEVTHEVQATESILQAIKDMGFPFALKVSALIRCFQAMYFENQGF